MSGAPRHAATGAHADHGAFGPSQSDPQAADRPVPQQALLGPAGAALLADARGPGRPPAQADRPLSGGAGRQLRRPQLLLLPARLPHAGGRARSEEHKFALHDSRQSWVDQPHTQPRGRGQVRLTTCRLKQPPSTRIVQYLNNRYAVLLVPIYWQTLEDLADRQRKRLGRFVAELADNYDGPNFSSFRRVFCMLEDEQALARETLGPTHHGLLDVVTNCPNPGLILSRYRTVIAYNSAFGEWLGPANVAK